MQQCIYSDQISSIYIQQIHPEGDDGEELLVRGTGYHQGLQIDQVGLDGGWRESPCPVSPYTYSADPSVAAWNRPESGYGIR